MSQSTPLIQDFDPRVIPFQLNVLRHLRREFDYSKGVAEMLCSGSAGSSKTLLGAHVMATHAVLHAGSQQLIVRRALKDLKNTTWRVLLDHFPDLRQWLNKSEMKITLPNGSIIYGASYDDGNFTRFRSYELSGAVIEEGTENDEEDLYNEILMRVGRLPHVPENYLMVITNPGPPSHFLYQKFIESPTPNRKVFYSLTEQNPFLPKTYVQQLRASLSEKMCKRMLEGQWIEISEDVVYSSYHEANRVKGPYKLDQSHPIHVTFDFNVGDGKPMSAALCQYVKDEFHFFSEKVVHGLRTLTLMEELASTGVFNLDHEFIINGDATGQARSSKSLHSDYEIIKQFLSQYQRPDKKPVRFSMKVPRANPPIKERHNKVNAYMKNGEGQVRLFVYIDQCPMLDKGFRLTALKKGGQFVEDDSKEYQHVTSAAGYTVAYHGGRVALKFGSVPR